LVIPEHPHHVTQRGARRLPVFLEDGDYRHYLALLDEWCRRAGTEIWAYCLMPNHVHLILVPSHADGLRAAVSQTHRRYARHLNRREGWHGHLWQERFHSFPMDEGHLLACARYVELNPVRAGLVRRPGDWQWSSAAARLAKAEDSAAARDPLGALVPDWAAFLDDGLDDAMLETIRRHSLGNRPLGSSAYLDRLSRQLGRDIRPPPRGRPRRGGADAN
jgi:putative transposase